MNNKQYVGRRVATHELYDEVSSITGVALIIDDENEILSGDDTGHMLEIDCKYGTQAMADEILASVAGKTYKGYRSTGAILSPTAELGDGVNVDGTYSLLAYRRIDFGPGHMSEIAAPGENTLEHEYEYKSPAQRESDRKIARTRSLIAKTAEEIRLEIKDEISGLTSSFNVSLEVIEGKISGLEGQYSTVSQTLEGLTVTTEEGSTKIKGDCIETDSLLLSGSISFVDSSGSTTTLQSAIDSAGGISASTARTLITEALVASPTIKGGTFKDLDEKGTLTLAINSEYANMPWLIFQDNTNDVGLFEVFPVNASSSWVVQKLGDLEVLSVYEGAVHPMNTWDFTSAEVIFGSSNLPSVTAVFS